MTSSLDDLIQHYINYIRIVRCLKEGTIEHHRITMLLLLSYCEEIGKTNVEDINIMDIQGFIDILKNKPKQKGSRYYRDPNVLHMSCNTIGLYISRIRGFFKRCSGSGYNTPIRQLLSAPRFVQSEIHYLTDQELMQVFSAPRMFECRQEVALRNEILLKIAFSGGLRIHEALNLRFSQIRGKVINIHGKYDSRGSIILTDEIVELLEKYKMLRKNHSGEIVTQYISKKGKECQRSNFLDPSKLQNDYIFISFSVNGRGDVITKEHVRFTLNGYIEKLGIKKHITFHSLRHTFATKLLEKGVDIRVTKAMMRVKNISCLSVYQHVTTPLMIQAHSTLRT